MTKSKIPSLLALFILLIILVSIIFALKEFQTIRSSAKTSLTPQDVKITNVTDDSFTISWLTDSPSIGFVEYSDTTSRKINTPPTPNFKTHLVRIQNLNSGSPYSFRINSNGTFFDNSSANWTIQTAPTKIAQSEILISGRVLNKNNFPAKNALVYVDTGFGTYSTTVTESGNWLLPIPAVPDSTLLQILVEESTTLMAQAKVTVAGANPTPTITLGNSYDFRNQEEKPKEETPQVPIQLP